MRNPRPQPVDYKLAVRQDSLLADVRAAFKTTLETQPSRELVFYDTFDWRLYKRRESLRGCLQSGKTQVFWDRWDGTSVGSIQLENRLRFAWDLPPGEFREAITPVIEMRRLFPVLEIRSQLRLLSILDGREKTVARLSLERRQIREPGTRKWKIVSPAAVRALPVRGYVKAFQELTDLLERLGLQRSDIGPDQEALRLIQPEAGQYSSKLQIHLDPSERSDQATKLILQQLLKTMLANEEGTWGDWDSEFLHDFRVACRRTRSALTQIKGVFRAPAVDKFRKGFKWLGDVTGPARDLDVYLLKIEGYRQTLPTSARADLNPLIEFLKRRRRAEQKVLARALQSSRYQKLIRDWNRFLEDPVPHRSSLKKAQRPIQEVASKRIWRSFRRVVKKGLAITPESPAEALHQVRIDCKKLRYLLEFFRSLYDPSELKQLIRSLKELQDCLGDFNDLEVQQESLRRFGGEMFREGVATDSTLISMGQLIDQLERLQGKEREKFVDRFGAFAHPSNQERCQTLFGGK